MEKGQSSSVRTFRPGRFTPISKKEVAVCVSRVNLMGLRRSRMAQSCQVEFEKFHKEELRKTYNHRVFFVKVLAEKHAFDPYAASQGEVGFVYVCVSFHKLCATKQPTKSEHIVGGSRQAPANLCKFQFEVRFKSLDRMGRGFLTATDLVKFLYQEGSGSAVRKRREAHIRSYPLDLVSVLQFS